MELDKFSFLSDKFVSQALQENPGNSINSEEKQKTAWVSREFEFLR